MRGRTRAKTPTTTAIAAPPLRIVRRCFRQTLALVGTSSRTARSGSCSPIDWKLSQRNDSRRTPQREELYREAHEAAQLSQEKRERWLRGGANGGHTHAAAAKS